jgi:hypothetical protein
MLAVQAGIMHNSPHMFLKKGNGFRRALGRAGCTFAARLLGHTYEELDARIIRTIGEYAKARGKYHLPTRDEKKGKEKKGCTFSAGHRAGRSNWCLLYTSYEVFFI